MSREEAVKVLTRMIDVGIEYDGGYGIEELSYDEEDACKMAIKALEQEQYYKDLAQSYEKTINKLTKAIAEQEPCEDCISREAVMYYIQAHISEIITESGIDKNEHTNKILSALINGVRTMPSVKSQEPKPGHWRLDTTDPDFPRIWHCPHCGKWQGYGEPPYCPWCGGKVDKEVSE